MFIGQPAEEIGAGARMMLDDGLFKRVPEARLRPGPALRRPRPGRAQSPTPRGWRWPTSIRWTSSCKGKGGHGAAPHTTIDPIVLAARIILDLQTIVSRETNPLDPCVVTVGSIHGGTKHNIIPNEVKLQLTVRTTKDAVRKHMLEAIERIAKARGRRRRRPEPDVTVDPGEFTPALVNDSALTRKTVGVFKQVLGEDNVDRAAAGHGRRGLQPLRPGGRADLPVLPGHDPGRTAWPKPNARAASRCRRCTPICTTRPASRASARAC